MSGVRGLTAAGCAKAGSKKDNSLGKPEGTASDAARATRGCASRQPGSSAVIVCVYQWLVCS